MVNRRSWRRLKSFTHQRSPAFLAWVSCTFYSGELGTFGNTDDILAPATCLESNVRFNFDHLFETNRPIRQGPPSTPSAWSPKPRSQPAWGSPAFGSMTMKVN